MSDELFCFRLNVFLNKFNTNFFKTNTIITSIKYSINLQLRKSILRSIKEREKPSLKNSTIWGDVEITSPSYWGVVSSHHELDMNTRAYLLSHNILGLKMPWRLFRKEVDYQKMEILFCIPYTLLSICIFIAAAHAAMRSIRKKIKLIILISFSFLLSFLNSAIIQVNPWFNIIYFIFSLLLQRMILYASELFAVLFLFVCLKQW